MANNQLDKTIQAGFQEERENVRDHSEEKKKGCHHRAFLGYVDRDPWIVGLFFVGSITEVKIGNRSCILEKGFEKYGN